MISKQVKRLSGSPIVQIFSLAVQREREGHPVIHLEIGQPDFPPFKPILDATIKAVQEKKTAYTPSRGIPELRQVVSQAYQEDHGLDTDPNTEVIITTGAKQGVLGSFFAVLDDGDQIIIPEPYWVAYPDIARLAGAEFIPLPMKPDFTLNQEAILSSMNSKIKAIVINTPNNPSGHILSRDEIKFLKDLVNDHNIFIISDEIYSDYGYIDDPVRTLLTEFEDWRQNIIVINGFAKTFAMTGYRLGWTVSQADIASGILKVIEATTTCPNSLSQWGGIAALENRTDARKFINQTFPERRRIILEEIQKTDGFSLESIDGAFYGFIKYTFTDKPSQEVAKEILLNTNVCVVPGTAFGDSAEGYLRITFCRSIEEIKEAFQRIREYIG
ncbi:MAG: pyridoxal phosphate-dependent aminotransferase [Candidatus Odinarchaeota archaeon]